MKGGRKEKAFAVLLISVSPYSISLFSVSEMLHCLGGSITASSMWLLELSFAASQYSPFCFSLLSHLTGFGPS